MAEEEPKPVVEEVSEEEIETNMGDKIRLFNQWSFQNITIKDESLKNYINLTPVIIPHSGGKHQHKRFWKTEHISIVERFINKIMSPGIVGKRIKRAVASKNIVKKMKLM